MKTKYIHYGHKEFDEDKFIEPVNITLRNKPFGGLWGSRVNADYGWKDWCKDNDFRKCEKRNSFEFTLSENANVFLIDSVEKLLSLPLQERVGTISNLYETVLCIDFEQCMEVGIDAIELEIYADPELYWILYGWDCDSIVILNKNIIVPVR